MARSVARVERPLEELLAALDVGELREMLAWAADWHEDVERKVRLSAARAAGDLSALRELVDRGLRTRRFLDWRAGRQWARDARPIVAELEAAAERSPSRELVELLQRAVSHIVKVLQTKADDSSGLIGDLARGLLCAHARACDAGVADPIKLAAWIVRFRFRDQDFFEADPVRYRDALGERGLACGRRSPAKRTRTVSRPAGFVSGLLCSTVTASRSSRCSGAISPSLISTSGSLRRWPSSGAITRCCGGAARGSSARAAGRPRSCTTSPARSTPGEKSRSRCSRCAAPSTRARRPAPPTVSSSRPPTRSTPGRWNATQRLRRSASATSARSSTHSWPKATPNSPGRPLPPLSTPSSACTAGSGSPSWRAATHPADALPIYWHAVEDALETADRRNYAQAVRLLTCAKTAAAVAGKGDDFQARLAALREQHRRRPTLIAMLNKAKLDPPADNR